MVGAARFCILTAKAGTAPQMSTAIPPAEAGPILPTHNLAHPVRPSPLFVDTGLRDDDVLWARQKGPRSCMLRP